MSQESQDQGMVDPVCSHCGNNSTTKIFPASLPGIPIYICSKCGYSVARIPMPSFKSRFVITRDDSNKSFTSIEQAIHVAEKLATENPTHTYYISKMIKKSKAVVATTVDIEDI
jgi:hypothetical protein